MNLNTEKGLAIGGMKVLSYRVDKNKRFVINEDEAPIVKKIFKMYFLNLFSAFIYHIKYTNY